jgi:hypothetical protein
LGKVRGRLIVLLDTTKLLAPASLLQASGSAESKTAKPPEARGASAR